MLPDTETLAAGLDTAGYATIGPLLTPEQCQALIASYRETSLFRKRIVMANHGYGSGEYQYFAYPLPALIQTLRGQLYEKLAPIANRWSETLNLTTRYPAHHEAFIAECHNAGQLRPTPLLLRYETGDYNCLHQDLYGALHFPFQAVFLLNQPGQDYTGGEFILTEQRPRMQSRAEVVTLAQGEAVIFAVSQRPVQGAKGPYRVTMRHGVSTLRSGQRHTLGIIMHDAT